MTPEQSSAMINRMIDQQAFMMSANDVFFASAILFLLLIGVIWLARPVKATAAAGASAAAAH
jgi:MFS transporter, DHA2 family, multidrug resistance protein